MTFLCTDYMHIDHTWALKRVQTAFLSPWRQKTEAEGHHTHTHTLKTYVEETKKKWEVEGKLSKRREGKGKSSPFSRRPTVAEKLSYSLDFYLFSEYNSANDTHWKEKQHKKRFKVVPYNCYSTEKEGLINGKQKKTAKKLDKKIIFSVQSIFVFCVLIIE